MQLCIVPQIKSPHFTTPSIQGYRLHNSKKVEMAAKAEAIILPRRDFKPTPRQDK